jgi:hypothetical protein
MKQDGDLAWLGMTLCCLSALASITLIFFIIKGLTLNQSAALSTCSGNEQVTQALVSPAWR